jgi:lipoprotein-anchoring transpeptidase ErfK/SrfK
MIFKGRVPTGVLAQPGGDDDHVLTRILWLEGIDPENVNTRERYIYIHGTNQEELIGTPASHGCIRLRNRAMLELFELAETGMLVEIRASLGSTASGA